MRLIKDTPFQFGMRLWRFEPSREALTVVVKGTFELAPSGALAIAQHQAPPVGETYYEGDGRRSLQYDTDFAPYKPRGEVSLTGHCYAPDGLPVRVHGASFRVGRVEKSLAVFGDRAWGPIAPSEPEPFVKMPLRWERCFGGADVKDNPLGVGTPSAPTVTPSGERAPRRLPNVENPAALIRDPAQRPAPHGAFPIPPRYPARVAQTGTHDKLWFETRWPYHPRDFDPHYYNTAPADQQIDGFFRGDERVQLQHLHPKWPTIDCQLPGLRPRCGLRYTRADAPDVPLFREVVLELDTIVLDPDNGWVLCTWRGITEVPDAAPEPGARTARPYERFDHVFVTHDPVDDPRLEDELRLHFEQRLADEVEAETVRADEPPPVPSVVSVLEPFRAKLAEAKTTPEEMAASFTRPIATLDLDELRRQIAEARARLGALAPGAARGAAGDPFERLERELAVLERARARSGTQHRERIVARLAAGERSFAREVLMGADFSGLDLTGVDLSRADLRRASFARATLDGANLEGADLRQADFTDASLRRAVLRLAAAENSTGARADFEDADLTGAYFDRAELPFARFHRARAARANLTRCDLRQASFLGLAGDTVDFSQSQLDASDFTGATLRDAVFEGATARRVKLSGCDLTKVRASGGTDFTESEMFQVRAPAGRFRGANLEGVRLSYSDLARADFSDAHLVRTVMDGCAMREARFASAVMVGAQALRADAMESDFQGADLSHADLRGSNLFGAEFFRAKLDEARLDQAIVGRTRLAPPRW